MYTGNFVEGIRHGRGRFVYSDGSEYSGPIKYGEKHGKGTQTWADGQKYVGEFVDGK